MRLQPAIALDDFQQDTVSGFGDRRARREARRARRQQRRQDRRSRRQDKRDGRREQRQERRLDRVQRRKAKVRDKLADTPPPPRRAPRRPPEPSLRPAPSGPPLAEPGWVDDLWDAAEEGFDPDEEEDDDHEDEGDDEDASTQGFGARGPFRRLAAGLRRATSPTPAADATGVWGPSVRMGKKLRIQAAAGHRAAVIDLKPGLFLVAELPEAVTRTEFGLAPVLAPLMVTAARRALDEPPRERRGPLAALFRRREPVRYVEVQHSPQVPAAPAPLALPGPVAAEPAPLVVPAPNVGWADDATVAAAYGCDRCERSRR